jgi:hypothetical protein
VASTSSRYSSRESGKGAAAPSGGGQLQRDKGEIHNPYSGEDAEDEGRDSQRQIVNRIQQTRLRKKDGAWRNFGPVRRFFARKMIVHFNVFLPLCLSIARNAAIPQPLQQPQGKENGNYAGGLFVFVFLCPKGATYS